MNQPKIKKVGAFLLCLFLIFASVAPPAAQAFVAEAAMVYKLAEVLLVGCGIYHVATSDASHALVEGLFNAYPTTKQMCDNYAQQVVGGKLWVTSKFLEDIKPFYQSVRDFFIGSSNDGKVAFAPFAGDIRTVAKSWHQGKVLLRVGDSPQIYKYSSSDSKFYVGVQPYYKNGGRLIAQISSNPNYEFPTYTTNESSSGAIAGNVVVDYVSDTGDAVYVKWICPDGSTNTSYIYLPSATLLPVSVSNEPYTVDQTLTADDVIDGWSRDWPVGSVDPDKAKAPVINIPADAGALTGAKAGDVWPRQDAGEVVVPGSPTLGNVYDRLGTLNDIASGVKVGTDSMADSLGKVGVGLGTLTDSMADANAKLGEIADALTEAPTMPSQSSLSLPTLIVNKFPFCIPFDILRLVSMFDVPAKEPRFVVPIKYGKLVDEEIVIDFTRWSDDIELIRWGELLLFVAGLIYVTRNYIKW